MLPHWFRPFTGYNPALLPPELALWNSSAMNPPALGNVPHAQGYDLPPVGTPMHLSHSGPFHDPTRSQSFPTHMHTSSNPPNSIPLLPSTSASSQPSDNHQQYLDQIRDELRTSLTSASPPAPTPPITPPTDATPPLPTTTPPLPIQSSTRDPTPPDHSNQPPPLPTAFTSKPQYRAPRSPLLRSRRSKLGHQSSRRRRRRTRSRSSRPRHRRRHSSSRSRTRPRSPTRTTRPRSPAKLPRSTPISLSLDHSHLHHHSPQHSPPRQTALLLQLRFTLALGTHGGIGPLRNRRGTTTTTLTTIGANGSHLMVLPSLHLQRLPHRPSRMNLAKMMSLSLPLKGRRMRSGPNWLNGPCIILIG